MKTSLITKFTRLVNDLKQERSKLADRMAEIDAVLASTSSSNGHVRSHATPRAGSTDKLTLREAITRVTKARPLTKPEIIAAVQKIGYKFTTNDPAGSTNALLYSKTGRAQFRNDAGKFSAK